VLSLRANADLGSVNLKRKKRFYHEVHEANEAHEERLKVD
jgi:hypothetical protein